MKIVVDDHYTPELARTLVLFTNAVAAGKITVALVPARNEKNVVPVDFEHRYTGDWDGDWNHTDHQHLAQELEEIAPAAIDHVIGELIIAVDMVLHCACGNVFTVYNDLKNLQNDLVLDSSHDIFDHLEYCSDLKGILP